MSRCRRVAARVGTVLGLLLAAAGTWVAFRVTLNPPVPFADPLIRRRPGPPRPVTVILGGDFAPTDAALPRLHERGWDYPYAATAHLLRDADLAFANLEAPVTPSLEPFPGYKEYLYRVEPDAVAAWQRLGLDLVGLANNHFVDYRERGMLDTLRHLEDAGIDYVGAGVDEPDARRPVIFEVGGTRIGFLAYLEHRLVWNVYLDTYAVGDTVGCAQLNPDDLEADVRRLRPLVDILIVSVHWGDNYAPITSTQEDYAARLADLGVDIVAGHHPHDVQAVDVLGDTVVLYSLGNYAWGTPGHAHLRIGLLARLTVLPAAPPHPPRLATVDLLPLVTQNRIVDFQPRPLARDELPWLDPFLAESRRRGTRLEVQGTRVRIVP